MEHTFCREIYKEVMKEVREKFTREQIDKAWVWKSSTRDWEFHGPNDEFVHGLRCADCSWSAKAAGWTYLIRKGDLQ